MQLRDVPRRIVSLAPNVTEMVAAAGGLDRLVGTDNFSNYPEAVLNLPKVGDMQPNVELITKLNPDLVITVSSANHAALSRALAAVQIPLFVVRTNQLDDVPRVISRLGELLNTRSIADAAAQRFRNDISAQRRSRARRPRVLFAVWLDPLYVAGRNNFVDDLINLAGGTNTVDIPGWPQYSIESLASQPPDVLVIASGSRAEDQLTKFFAETPPWNGLAAVKSRFWYVVDEDQFARPGPRTTGAAAKLNSILDQWEQKQKP